MTRKPKTPKAPCDWQPRRNPFAVAVRQRPATVLKDRRQSRGGVANLQRQWLALYLDEPAFP